MTHDRPLLGILLMLGFCALAPMGDAVAKILAPEFGTAQLVLVRFGVQAAVLAPLVLVTGRSLRMSRRVFWLALLRTLLHIGGFGCMYAALAVMPLADAIAIAFVMPFIMLLLGRLVLNEEVGLRRLAACAVGFVGTLMVIQPAFDEVGAAALLPVAVAVIFALFMLVTRAIARDTDPVALQATSGLMAVALVLPALVVAGPDAPRPLGLTTPDGTALWLFLLMGLLGTAAHLLMTWSLRHAPSATLAPMQYVEIPMATLIGFLVFGDLPDGLAAAGILVTIAAGLYIILREQAMSQPSRRTP